MKKILLLSLILFSLISCEKYEEPTLLSLSGEYVIDKVTFEKVDNAVTYDDTVYLPGTTYINPLERFPMDTINVGFTKWHLDYSVISMCPIPTSTGQYLWTKQYFYDVINHYSNYDLGYIEFNCEGSRRVFKIIDDQAESLTLRSTGQWGYAEIGPDISLTLHLTRIGP
jgi:hypothetical protein